MAEARLGALEVEQGETNVRLDVLDENQREIKEELKRLKRRPKREPIPA